MIDVRVGFAVDDLREHDIVELLRVMDPILAAPTGASWTLDLTGCQYLGPAAAVVIASSRLVAATKSQVAVVKLPQLPPALRAFCSFAGLDSLVAGRSRRHRT